MISPINELDQLILMNENRFSGQALIDQEWMVNLWDASLINPEMANFANLFAYAQVRTKAKWEILTKIVKRW